MREISWREFEKFKGSTVDVENFEIRLNGPDRQH
jgi:hypothetical protein